MPDDVKLDDKALTAGANALYAFDIDFDGNEGPIAAAAIRAYLGALPSLPSDIDGLVDALEAERRKWFCSGRDCTDFDHGRDEGLKRAVDIAALRARQAPEGVVEAVAKAIFDTWAKFKGVDGTWEEALQGHFEGSDTYPAAHEIVELARLEARAALSAMPSGAGWQPIDTAPKDGKTILAAHKHAIFTVYWEAEGDTDTDEPGWCDGDMNRYEELTTYNPTHWMPLPAPPAGQPS